jgi:hypothetical protein
MAVPGSMLWRVLGLELEVSGCCLSIVMEIAGFPSPAYISYLEKKQGSEEWMWM